jgi:hypothetical protein
MVSEVSPESSMQSYGTGVFPRTVVPLSGPLVGSPSVMGEPPRGAVIDQTSVCLIGLGVWPGGSTLCVSAGSAATDCAVLYRDGIRAAAAAAELDLRQAQGGPGLRVAQLLVVRFDLRLVLGSGLRVTTLLVARFNRRLALGLDLMNALLAGKRPPLRTRWVLRWKLL